MTLAETTAELSDWIIRYATARNDPEGLLDGACKTMIRGGLPIWQASVAAPAIDPLFRGAILNWWRDRPTNLVTVEHGPAFDQVFERSPIRALRAKDIHFARWGMDTQDEPVMQFVQDELHREGGSDCVMFLVDFATGTALEGAAISFSTDRSTGFQDHEIRMLGAIVPALGLAIFRQLLLYSATKALDSYLGPLSSAQILAGHVRRGEGRSIAAAILLADLSGFTAMTDRENPARVVPWLNEHFEAIGEPVTANGGEILKFLGDGLLAVFPAADQSAKDCPACASALLAAEQALARNRLLNARRKEKCEPQLEVDVVLHYGEVVYGNVGTSSRLDLTMIGRAVNEASRIEKLCDQLQHHILISAEFASRSGKSFVDLGAFQLRGVGNTRSLMTVAPPTAAPRATSVLVGLVTNERDQGE